MGVETIAASAISGISAQSVSSGISGDADLPGAMSYSGTTSEVTPFSDLFTGAVEQVNALQAAAQMAVTGLMSGSGVDVHQAMIATEKANMAFELSLAVRNKAVGAYQQVMSMQF